jgi:hypothetical protein
MNNYQLASVVIASLIEYSFWDSETFIEFSHDSKKEDSFLTFARIGQRPDGRDRKPFLKVELRNGALSKILVLAKVTRSTDDMRIIRSNALVLKVLSVMAYNAIAINKNEMFSILVDNEVDSDFVTLITHPRVLDGYFSFKYNRQGDMIICSRPIKELQVIHIVRP